MSRGSSRKHYSRLPTDLEVYCELRSIEFIRFSPYHMRLSDGGFVTIDIWTTKRYYVLSTDYNEMLPDRHIRERGGEKGSIPYNGNEYETMTWLDQLFFPIPETDDEV